MSNSLGVDQLVELLHGHVLLRARERAGEILVEPVGQDGLGLLRRPRVALHEVVERALRVEHQRVQVAGPVALHLRGRVGERLHAQGVGQPPRRVDRHHAGAPAGPGRRQREGGRHRRLADPARPAAHHDGPLGHQLGQRRRAPGRRRRHAARSAAGRGAHDAPSGTSAVTASASGVGQHLGLGRPDGGRVERRHQEVGQGQVPAQALDLLGRDGVAGQPEVPGLLECGQVLRRHGEAGRLRHLGCGVLEPDGLGVTGVDDDRAQLDARLVFERVGGLDRLGDRQLFGQRDQHHPAAGGVAQQLDDVLGLGAQWPAPGRADQPAGRGQERDGVAGGGGVHQDQVGDAVPLQLLDLAEDQHVADARDGGRDDVEDPGVRQPLGHALQAVVLEILDQRVVGCEPPGPDRAGGGPPVRPATGRRCQQDFFVAQVPVAAEGRRDARLALELDDQHRFACSGGHLGQGRAHGRLAHAALAGNDEDVALCAEGTHVHAGPSVVAGPRPQIDRRPKILVTPLESDHPRR